MNLARKVVIVTGASQGIGEMIARELVRHDASVVLAARQADRLEALADDIRAQGGRALAVPADLRQRADIDRIAQAAINTFGQIDVLVNNAGVVEPRIGVVETPDETLENMLLINVLGPARCTQAVVPHMRKQGGGVIVNIGSVAGEIATGDLYSATKFGVRGLSDALRRELRRDNIAIVLVEPGFIRREGRELGRIPQPGPEDVARVVVRAIERPRRKIITPWPYVPIVFGANLLPGLIDRFSGRRKRSTTAGEATSGAPPSPRR